MTGLRSAPSSVWGRAAAILRYGRRVPLALAAVAVFAPAALAAGHRAPMPAHRSLAMQPVRPGRGASSKAKPVEQAKHGDRRALAATGARSPRGSRGMAYTAALRGREIETAHERAVATRPGRGSRLQPQVAAAEKPGRLALRHGRKMLPAVEPVQDEQAEAVADRRTSARIHAWYSHRNASASTADQTAAARHAAVIPDATLASVPPSVPAPPIVRKAAVPYANPAATVQSTASLAAAESKEHQTTAADDNADAESHIPSTAPTERVPSPFVHGDALQADPLPANHSRVDGAPVVRQQPAIAASEPGRGLPPQTTSRSTPSPVAAIVPQRVDLRGGTSPAAGAALTKAAPAAAAVQTNSRHPKLDPAVAEGMAEENFDDDGAPATARTAVTLASAGPVAGRKKLAAAQDDSEPLQSLAAVNVNLYDGSGHLLVMAPMKGSHEILVHQNQMALSDGLERVQDDAQLSEMRRQKLLVALPNDDTVYPNDVLPLNRRYARPWTVRFLRDMGRAHYARFGTPLIVTSAVRTVAFQRHLVRVNANAAPPTGDIASPHLYGQAIDIGKRGMSLTELTWMRAYLTPVENDGKIDVEEEFQQACFHISVYRRYAGTPDKLPNRLEVPTLMQAKTAPAPEVRPEAKQERRRRLPTALLATGLR